MTAVDVDALVRHIKRNPDDAAELAAELLPRADVFFYDEDDFVRELQEWNVWDVLTIAGECFKLTFDEGDDFFLVSIEDDREPIVGLKRNSNLGGEVAGLLEKYGIMDDIASGEVEIPAGIRRRMAGKASKNAKRPSAGARKPSVKRKATPRSTGTSKAKRPATSRPSAKKGTKAKGRRPR